MAKTDSKYRVVFVDNFHLINKATVEKIVGHNFDDNTWRDFCTYLEDNVKVELEDLLVESLSKYCAINEYHIGYEEYNLPIPEIELCTAFALRKIYCEIIQHRVKRPRITSMVIEQFRKLFDYLVIKYCVEYINMMD